MTEEIVSLRRIKRRRKKEGAFRLMDSTRLIEPQRLFLFYELFSRRPLILLPARPPLGRPPQGRRTL